MELTYKAGWNFGVETNAKEIFDMRGKMPRKSAKSDEFYRGYWAYREALIKATLENARTGAEIVFPTAIK